MRTSVLGLFVIAILAFSSCSKSDSKIKDINSDAQLIEAIQKATNKQNILVSELPSSSQTLIAEEYVEDYVDAAKLAPKLGYEVDLKCNKGPRVGEYSQAYFDLNGRKLQGDKDYHGDKGDKGDKGKICFEFVYPVTFIMPDGTEFSIDGKDDEEGWGEIKSWYEAHPDVNEKPAVEFPVDIKFKDGKIVTVNSQEEMQKIIESCKGDKGDKDKCFELVLPVTYTMPDNSDITIETREDYMLIKTWYAEHPDVKKRPALQFPVDIKWYEGTVETINSKEAMKAAKAKCDKGDKGGKRCFKLVYPVTYTMPDGSEITIENKEDRMLIREWYEAHPDVNEKPALVFPVEIKYKDGTVVTINDKEEMMQAKKECGDKGDKGKRCFRLVYPVTFIMPNGDEIIIATKEDRMQIKEWYITHPDVNEKPELEYPVEIAYFDNDVVVTINNKEEMLEAKADCKGEDEEGDKD